MCAKISAQYLQALLQFGVDRYRQVIGKSLHTGELPTGSLILLVEEKFWCQWHAEMLDGIG